MCWVPSEPQTWPKLALHSERGPRHLHCGSNRAPVRITFTCSNTPAHTRPAHACQIEETRRHLSLRRSRTRNHERLGSPSAHNSVAGDYAVPPRTKRLDHLRQLRDGGVRALAEQHQNSATTERHGAQ